MDITGSPTAPYDGAARVTAWINAPGSGEWCIDRLTAISEGRNRRMAAHGVDGFATPIFRPPPPMLARDFVVAPGAQREGRAMAHEQHIDSTNFQRNIGAVIDAVANDKLTMIVERHGRPQIVLVPVDEYELLVRDRAEMERQK